VLEEVVETIILTKRRRQRSPGSAGTDGRRRGRSRSPESSGVRGGVASEVVGLGRLTQTRAGWLSPARWAGWADGSAWPTGQWARRLTGQVG
jgi:hypothetical protein